MQVLDSMFWIYLNNLPFVVSMCCSMYMQGAAIDRILGEIVHNKGMKAPIDYVLCIGHFLPKVCFFLTC